MPRSKLIITQGHLDQIVAQARAEPDREVCGLLGGQGDIVKGVFPVPNSSPTPTAHFMMNDQSFIDTYFAIERKEWELIAIYHSHPAGVQAYPSPTDVAEANYPEALNLIVSISAEGEPEARAFHIAKGIVHEVPLEILSDLA